MKPLLCLSAALVAGAGHAFWQQGALEGVRDDIRRLSEQLMQVRQSIDSDQVETARLHRQLNRLRTDLHDVQQESAATLVAVAASRTPEKEGWWPEDRSYFYLPKESLRQVRFRRRRLPIEEANALLTERAKASDPSVLSVHVGIGDDASDVYPFEERFLDGGKINPDVAALLGMNEAEVEGVDRTYLGLLREVHRLEAERIELINPPVPAGTPNADQMLVARLSNLSPEVDPLLDRTKDSLEQMLGKTRAEILSQQSETYFDRFAYKLGLVPREFIRDKNMLIVQFSEKWGKHQAAETVGIPVPKSSGLFHLFGPGAPCELK
jgi:hypothetical protein